MKKYPLATVALFVAGLVVVTLAWVGSLRARPLRRHREDVSAS